MREVPLWFLAASVLAAIVGAVGSYAFGQIRGLEGFALGVGGSLFNLGATWAVIRLMSELVHSPKPERRGTLVVVAAFLIKVPLFVGLAVLANRIGGPALGCFLMGVALVYCGLVGWMLARR